MSTISGGKGSDALSRFKDLYTQKERDLQSRHREEIKELKEMHRVELERLQAENKKRVSAAQEDASSKINQRDIKHQKEIETLRTMYDKRSAKR
jgi:hypothetical protein